MLILTWSEGTVGPSGLSSGLLWAFWFQSRLSHRNIPARRVSLKPLKGRGGWTVCLPEITKITKIHTTDSCVYVCVCNFFFKDRVLL